MKCDEKISCEFCKKEIPKSVVINVEGAEYTFHFCCPDCHDHFFAKNPELRAEKAPGG